MWRQLSWRNAIVVAALGLSAFAWSVYEFLSHPIMGAHVFTGFDQLATPPIERQAPDGTPYKLYAGRAIIGCAVRPDDAHSQRVFPSHGAAMQYAREHELPTVPSVSTILASCRVADARLQIALEHDLERHADGRAALLDGWIADVMRRRALATAQQQPTYSRAIQLIALAIRFGGGSPTLPDNVTLPTPTIAGPGETPIGPWAADTDMAAIWRRDRFLATALPITDDETAAVAAVLARSLVADPHQAAGWQRQARVAAALVGQPTGTTLEALADALTAVADQDLTSPQTCAQIRTLCAQHARPDGTALAPAYAAWASSPEEATLSATGMDAWADPFAALIAAIRSGEVHLEPTADSGFYRRWWYALEPLAAPECAPERGKLQLTAAYTTRWQRAFAAGFTDGRSSIVKRMPVVTLGAEAVGPISVQVAPAFSCEPAPAVYLRLARAYRTLAQDLALAMGNERWRALTDAQGQSVAAALDERSARLLGIAVQSYREIGYPLPLHDDERTIDQAKASADGVAWCAVSALDPDVTADARHLVTLASDGAGHYRCPAIAGVRLEPVRFSWIEKPSVSGDVDPEFVPVDYWLTSPCVLVTTVERVPTPEEFRHECDRHERVADLYTALQETPLRSAAPSATSSLTWLVALSALLLSGCTIGTWGVVCLAKRRRWALAAMFLVLPIAPLVWACWAPPYWLVRLVAVHVLTVHENIAMEWQDHFSRWAAAHHDTLFYDLLAEPDPQRRYWACWLYVPRNSAVTPTIDQVTILDRALNDSVEEVAYIAWYVLCRSRLPSADLLSLMAKHPEFALRKYTVQTLANERPKDPAVIAQVITQAGSERAVPRAQAYAAISNWKAPTADLIAVLRTGITHADATVRRIAVDGLGRFGTEADLPAILTLLADPESTVRIATFQRIYMITIEIPKSVSQKPRLTASMDDPLLQRALAGYVHHPAATFAERMSASRWLYDAELLRREIQELMALADTLPSSSERYVSERNGYAKKWSREQATTRLIIRYFLAETIPTWDRSRSEDTSELEINPWLLEHLADGVRHNADFSVLLATLADALKQSKEIEATTTLIHRIGKPAAALAQPLADLHDRSTGDDIRWWTACALGDLGPDAASLAIPRLQVFVAHPDHGRSAKYWLEQLQPGAASAADSQP